MAKKGEDPEVLRLVVGFLRFFRHQTQAEFAEASGLNQNDISFYEWAKQRPMEKNLRRMAAAAGVPWAAVGHLRRFYAALLAMIRGGWPGESLGSGGSGAQPAADWLERAILEPAFLAIASYRADEAAEAAEKEGLRPTTAELFREAGQTWEALARFPVGRRRRVAELLPESCRTWALAVRACEASLKAAAHKAEEALELAALALDVASSSWESKAQALRLQGWCWGHIGNARRVATDFDGADEAFAHAWQLWQAGEPIEPGWLAEWLLLSLEASLRREQRRLPEALELLDRAMAGCDGEPAAMARCLLKKEHVFEVMGDIHAALAVLTQAAPYVAASGDPHLLFIHHFNEAKNLCHLQRFTEAGERLPEIGELVLRQGAELEGLRVDWLAARVAAGQGRKDEAMAGLEQVGRRFTDLKLPYEAALSSLELAVLWLEKGRTAEVRGLALAMAWIFKAKGIRREALAALHFFREAALRDSATVELARRVIAEIETVRRSAPLRLAGEEAEGTG